MLHVVPQSAHLCAGPSKSGGNNRETMIKLQNEVFPYSIGAQLVKRSKPFALNFPFIAQLFNYHKKIIL